MFSETNVGFVTKCAIGKGYGCNVAHVLAVCGLVASFRIVLLGKRWGVGKAVG